MIPEFPNFAHIKVSDRALIESYTHQYPPYSDFNFTSLWTWDTAEERRASILNNNLVIHFTDYSTHEPFFSFLGNSQPEKTAVELLTFASQNGFPEVLRLVPEISVANIHSSILRIDEDRDNFDYIYSVPELATLRGNKYMSKRGRGNKFRRENPEAHVEIIDLAHQSAQRDIFEIINAWERSKIDDEKPYEIAHERAAIRRLCDTAAQHTLIATGVFSEGSMYAFSIEEILPAGYSICHFWKADSSFQGIFDFLMQEKAKHLEVMGSEWINYEQDLGVAALRAAKDSFRPSFFLKKYQVSLL